MAKRKTDAAAGGSKSSGSADQKQKPTRPRRGDRDDPWHIQRCVLALDFSKPVTPMTERPKDSSGKRHKRPQRDSRRILLAHILLVLAVRASKAGRLEMYMSNLAQDVGIDVRTLRKYIAWFEVAGFLRRELHEPQRGELQGPTTFVLHFRKWDAQMVEGLLQIIEGGAQTPDSVESPTPDSDQSGTPDPTESPTPDPAESEATPDSAESAKNTYGFNDSQNGHVNPQVNGSSSLPSEEEDSGACGQEEEGAFPQDEPPADPAEQNSDATRFPNRPSDDPPDLGATIDRLKRQRRDDELARKRREREIEVDPRRRLRA